MSFEKRLLQRLRGSTTALVQAASDAQILAEERRREIQARLDSVLANGRRDQRLAVAWAESFAPLGLAAAPWEDPAWDEYQPALTPPLFVRFGTLSRVGRFASFESPALVPFMNGRNLVIRAGGEARAAAVGALQSLTLRLLALIPAGKLKLLMIDPVGLGENVATFMHLSDFGLEWITGKAWVERGDIERRLADLSGHMETVIQSFLRGRYRTMEEYNHQAEEVAEAYRLLVVMNFPVGFTDEAARRLLSIAQNGPRCGVYTLLTVDPAQYPRNFSHPDLEATACLVEATKDGFVWRDPDFHTTTLRLDAPPDVDRFERLVKAVGAAAVRESIVQVPFTRLAPSPADLRAASAWTDDNGISRNSAEGLRIPLGRAGARKEQEMELGKGMTHHVLVAGRIGSGKSNLLHVVVTGLAARYSPEELELYLVDFKRGVEFKPYAAHALPHARVVAIESEREFGLSVLRRLDQEMKERGEAFRASGTKSLASHRQAVGVSLPRVLLLVDEFQEFFTEDDPLAREASLLLDRLARQGRAFGMHLMLGSQTLAGGYSLARTTVDQVAVRIALQCSEADSTLILGSDNPAARLLTRPGDAIYNAMSGLKEGNERFQVAWLPDAVHEEYLEALRARADAHPTLRLRTPIVFEGSAPARLGDRPDHPLRVLLASAGPPTVPTRALAWLGEPVAIQAPTAASFFRRGGRNLLVVGRDEDQAIGMLAAALLGLTAQQTAGHARFQVADLSMAAVDGTSFAAPLAAALPATVRLLEPHELAGVVADLAQTVAHRQAGAPRDEAIYLVIAGLHRARVLRQEGGGYRSVDAPPTPGAQFLSVLRDGSEVGVHVVAWADSAASLHAVLVGKALGEFGMRVALSMPEKDSLELLGSPAAARLRPFRGIFYDEERPAASEVFRPYEAPSGEWLERLAARPTAPATREAGQ